MSKTYYMTEEQAQELDKLKNFLGYIMANINDIAHKQVNRNYALGMLQQSTMDMDERLTSLLNQLQTQSCSTNE